jgi:hypothetical protein
MHRRPLGSGRRLALLGAIVVVIGCVLPWYSLGGEEGQLTAVTWTAFSSLAGILTFLAGLGTLALIALPYAAGERPVGIDRGLAFGLLAVLALLGLVLWFPAAGVLDAPEGLLPTRALGYWIAAVGSIMLARAAYDISLEPPRR